MTSRKHAVSHPKRGRPPAWLLSLGSAALLAACNTKSLAPSNRDQRQPTLSGLTQSKVVVPTMQVNGQTRGAVVANAMFTQVLEAGSNSAISGSSVAFPPGSLAIDTEVSLAPATTIGNTETLKELELGTEVSRSGAPVEIKSSTPTDTITPFTLAIPLPDGSGLTLTGDPLANLSIVYFVKKISQGAAAFTGVIPRSQIDVSSGYAKFSTTYFGTYQTIITAAPIIKAVEKPIEPVTQPKPVPKPVQSFVGYYAAGFMTSTFEPALPGQRQEGLQGMLIPFGPYLVGSSHRLSTSFISFDYQKE